MITVILKPTDGCNAGCRYCAAAHPGSARTMDLPTLRQVLTLVGEYARRHGGGGLHLLWHGGEPLLMPDSFWQEVFRIEEELLRPSGLTVTHGIQTNATLIRSSTLPMLVRLLGPHGTVGTSVDPLPGIRELKTGATGSYGEALSVGLSLLKKAGLKYGLLHVVHRHALPRLREIYRTLRLEHPKAGIRFNPLYRQGRAGGEGVWDDLGITSQDWGEALVTLHEAWEEDGAPEHVQPFGPWARLRNTQAWQLSCECSGTCVRGHLGVDPDGSMHLCGRSADGGAFRFGHVSELDADQLQRHPLRQTLINRMVYLRRTHCRACTWWTYCHGGCANDALLDAMTPFAPTSFCAGLRTFFAHALLKGEAAS